jgi:hypothetical protein
VDGLFNWRTTLAGIILATSNLVVAYLEGQMDIKAFLLSAAIAVFGYLAKDASKTGTLSSPKE